MARVTRQVRRMNEMAGTETASDMDAESEYRMEKAGRGVYFGSVERRAQGEGESGRYWHRRRRMG